MWLCPLKLNYSWELLSFHLITIVWLQQGVHGLLKVLIYFPRKKVAVMWCVAPGGFAPKVSLSHLLWAFPAHLNNALLVIGKFPVKDVDFSHHLWLCDYQPKGSTHLQDCKENSTTWKWWLCLLQPNRNIHHKNKLTLRIQNLVSVSETHKVSGHRLHFDPSAPLGGQIIL
jgi:hypothetical protein